MLVKDVVALAAENLGRTDLAKAIASASGTGEGEVASLLRCYNLVENEVALDFFPLKAAEQVVPDGGRVSYAELGHAPVDVYKVTVHGAPVAFELYPTHLYLPCKPQSAEILYAYSPEEKKLTDETAFRGKISARLLAFGVASEFCVTNGQYAEGGVWGRKYRDALRAAGIFRHPLSVRARRWV